MCSDPSLLVHECTNAAIPELIQRGEKGRTVRTKDVEPSLMGPNGYGKVGDQGPTDPEEQGRKEREDKMKGAVRNKAQSRGHSTPDEVGEFAGKIRARRVVVNHFSAM
jgi:ribonuclease Z